MLRLLLEGKFTVGKSTGPLMVQIQAWITLSVLSRPSIRAVRVWKMAQLIDFVRDSELG